MVDMDDSAPDDRTSPDATSTDLDLPFLLTSAFDSLVDAVHASLAADGFPGIRAVHGFAMQAIGPGCTSVELGHRLGVSKQAATQTAKALTELGLIDRETNVRDRREVILVPSPRGREMLRLSAAAFRREIGRWRSEVGDGTIDTLLEALRTVTGGSGAPAQAPRR